MCVLLLRRLVRLRPRTQNLYMAPPKLLRHRATYSSLLHFQAMGRRNVAYNNLTVVRNQLHLGFAPLWTAPSPRVPIPSSHRPLPPWCVHPQTPLRRRGIHCNHSVNVSESHEHATSAAVVRHAVISLVPSPVSPAIRSPFPVKSPR